MVFIETPVFTRQIRRLISDEQLRLLQKWIATVPMAGDLIRGGGGCRKIRWFRNASGKRSGIRVIYYWMKDSEQILFLLAYAKTQDADLTPGQVKVLGKLVKDELRRHKNG